MDIYVDLDNFYSYACKGGSEHFTACNEMLKQNFNIHFTFSQEMLQNCKKKLRIAVMPLLKSFTRNRGKNKTIWASPFPGHPLSDDFYDSLSKEQLMSLYWLSDNKVKDYEQDGCLLISSLGDELKSLLQLFIEDKANPTKKYPIREMNDWSVIRNNTSPCTDIVIIDPFLFAQSDFLYDRNAFKVISEVALRVKGRPLNIVIFTNAQYKVENRGYVDIPIPSIQRRLKEVINEQCGAEPNITIVKLPKKEEHDRTIITNYKVFISGDSFKYFDDNGQNVSNGRWFDVCSLAHNENRELVINYLKDLQEIVNSQKTGLMNIVGDKKSSFLSFS